MDTYWGNEISFDALQDLLDQYFVLMNLEGQEEQLASLRRAIGEVYESLRNGMR